MSKAPDPMGQGAADRQLREMYRDTFLESRQGREVLKNVLFELGYFLPSVKSEGQVARRNYATRLVMIIGPEAPDLAVEGMLDSWAKSRGGE